MSTISKNNYKFNIDQNIFIDFNNERYLSFDLSSENLIKYNDNLEETLYFFRDIAVSMNNNDSINTLNRLICEYKDVKEKLLANN